MRERQRHRERACCYCSEFRNCVKVEVDVLGFLSLLIRTVSVDVKQHSTSTVIVVVVVID